MDMHLCRGSSQVKAFGYDRAAERLALEFHAGGTYVYAKVPFAVFERFLRADSKGSFVHRELKGKFELESNQ